jgi:hypothetical protein
LFFSFNFSFPELRPIHYLYFLLNSPPHLVTTPNPHILLQLVAY